MSLFGQFLSQQSRNNATDSNMQNYAAQQSASATNFNEDDFGEDIIEETFVGYPNQNIGQSVQNVGRQVNSGQYLRSQSMSGELGLLRQENEAIKNAITELRTDRDKLRVAVRKLKVENSRFKAKLKRISTAVTSKRRPQQGEVMDVEDALDDDLDLDFDDIGEFLLIGGQNDPLAVQYRSPIRDAAGIEHKSVESYLWYKMAETFNDQDAMKKILEAETSTLAEEIARNIVNFDQKTWDAVKLRHWEDGQRMKLEQYRWVKCLLIKTGKHYLAVASQDKVFGTGWRKQRDEAARPHMWDGENKGGKFLMKLRDQYASNHVWTTTDEEQEATNAFYENKRNIWKKSKRDGNVAMRSTRARGRRIAKNITGNTIMDTRMTKQEQSSMYTGIANPNYGYPTTQAFPKRTNTSRGGTFDKRTRF